MNEQRFYSPGTGCTYLPSIHGENIPPDAVPISEDRYAEVITNPAPDTMRDHDGDGLPVLVPFSVPELTRVEVEALRLRAYADPINGSDRYFSEAARMQAMGESGWEAVRAAGVERYQAIQAEFPWPAEGGANV